MKKFTLLSRILLLVASLLAQYPARLLAQGYQLPATGTASYTTCAGTLYDDGGPTAPYAANCTGSVTLSPGTAGTKLKLTFSECVVTSGFGEVLVFDGPTTTAPLIGSYTTARRPSAPLYATSASGALTVQLRSGAYVPGEAGFAASIECVSQVPLPDLAAQNLRLSPTNLLPGAVTTARAQLANLSGGLAPSSDESWYVSRDSLLSRDDILLLTSQPGPLPAGTALAREMYLRLPASLAPGSYYVLQVADPANTVAESDETNNVASARLRLSAPAPDLRPNPPGFRPSIITPATGSVAVDFSIRNQGVLPTDSAQVALFFSTQPELSSGAVLLGRTAIGPLLAGATSAGQLVSFGLPAGTKPGTYYVFVVADDRNAIAEVDETNNVVANSFTVVAATVDLGLQYPMGPAQASPGQALTSLYVRLNNQGSEVALPATIGYFLSTDNTFSPDDALMGTSSLVVPAYDDRPVRGRPVVPASTVPGHYYLLYVADYLNQLAESDETNNVAALPLDVVAPNIDLTIGSPRLLAPYRSPDRAVPGQTQNLGAGGYLTNRGTTAAAPATLGLYLSADDVLSADDQLLAADSVAYLPPSYAPSLGLGFGVPAGTVPGRYYVLLVADYRHQLPDTDRRNNVVALPLDVIAPEVDLSIDNAGALPNTVNTGDRLAVRGALYNQGLTAAIPATVGYYLSRDTQPSPDDVLLGQWAAAELNPSTYGSAAFADTVVVPATTAAGAYYVLLVANHLGRLPESNKANNVYPLPLTVSAAHPDLAVQAASLDPATATNGTLLAVRGTVANVGPVAAASSTSLGYYLSADDRWDPSDRLLLARPVVGLGPGQAEPYSAQVLVPTGQRPGRYFLLLVADPGQKIVEASRTNNVAALALTLTGPFAGWAVPTSGATSLRACAGLLYDNGGLATYAPYSNGILTLTPSTPDALSQLIFSEFDTELGPHYLQVYDGPSTKSPLLGLYSGRQLPAAITASAGNASGALTLRFVSDGSASGSGFVARINCVSRVALAGRPAALAGYELRVLPVPVASPAPLHVQLSGPGPQANVTLALYNSLGQAVRTQSLALLPGRSNQAELPTAGLAAGVYVLRLTGPALNATRRVVIE